MPQKNGKQETILSDFTLSLWRTNKKINDHAGLRLDSHIGPHRFGQDHPSRRLGRQAGRGNHQRGLAPSVPPHGPGNGKGLAGLHHRRAANPLPPHRHRRARHQIQRLRIPARLSPGLRRGQDSGTDARGLRWHGAIPGSRIERLPPAARTGEPAVARR